MFDWSFTLDDDEIPEEQFDVAPGGEELLAQLNSDDHVTACRWGELVDWYRSVPYDLENDEWDSEEEE